MAGFWRTYHLHTSEIIRILLLNYIYTYIKGFLHLFNVSLTDSYIKLFNQNHGWNYFLSLVCKWYIDFPKSAYNFRNLVSACFNTFNWSVKQSHLNYFHAQQCIPCIFQVDIHQHVRKWLLSGDKMKYIYVHTYSMWILRALYIRIYSYVCICLFTLSISYNSCMCYCRKWYNNIPISFLMYIRNLGDCTSMLVINN